MVKEKEHINRMEPKTEKVKVASGSPSAGSLTKFWTACSKCKMQSEYPRKFLKRRICCCNCGKMFVGTEIPAPSRSQGESSGVLPQAVFRQNLRAKLAKNKKSLTSRKDSVPAAGEKAGLSDGEQVARVVQPSKDKPKKRSRDEATEVASREIAHVVQPSKDKPKKRGHAEATEVASRENFRRGKFSSSSKAATDLSGGAQKSSNPVLPGIDLNKLPSEAAEEPSTCNSNISVRQIETLEAILRITRMVAKKR